MGVMDEESQLQMNRSICALLGLAEGYSIPVYCTEQYPRGLGHTVTGIRENLPKTTKIIEKTEFSAVQNPAFQEILSQGLPEDILLTGMETHICVLQTAVDLMALGYRVFVVRDGVASRAAENRENGLALMQSEGAVITNSETVIFQFLKKAEGPLFKKLSKLIR
tara:strand:- start:350 stop:844 length:495 start_codon:yes stop_codon:yes gene_type:complete